tara:strand:- start:318 stop:458 length:141 start_codon:yes stop_codon:yes gene_type:complete
VWFCEQGFSEGKSDVANLQRPFVKFKIEQLFLYNLAAGIFLFNAGL